jgi:ribosomal protein S27AE
MPPKKEMIDAQRPPCPACGMKMVATKPLVFARQTFECLRCGHTEKTSASPNAD